VRTVAVNHKLIECPILKSGKKTLALFEQTWKNHRLLLTQKGLRFVLHTVEHNNKHFVYLVLEFEVEFGRTMNSLKMELKKNFQSSSKELRHSLSISYPIVNLNLRKIPKRKKMKDKKNLMVDKRNSRMKDMKNSVMSMKILEKRKDRKTN